MTDDGGLENLCGSISVGNAVATPCGGRRCQCRSTIAVRRGTPHRASSFGRVIVVPTGTADSRWPAGRGTLQHPPRRPVPRPNHFVTPLLSHFIFPYNSPMSGDWLFWISAMLLGLPGAGLLLWSLFGDRSRGGKRCPKCWYDMDRSPTLCCSECGHEVRRERKLYKTRRRWRGVVVSTLLLLLATGLAIQPKVQRDGWVSVLPLTVVAYGLYLDENDWAKDELKRRYPGVSGNTIFEGPPVGENSRVFRVGYRVLARAAWQVATDEATPQIMEQWEFFGFFVYAAQRARDSGDVSRLTRELRELACGDDTNSKLAPFMLSRVLDPDAAAEAILHLIDEACLAPHEAIDPLGQLLLKTNLALPYVIKAVSHESVEVRRSALLALREWSVRGGTSVEVIEAMEVILNRRHLNGDPRSHFDWALWTRLALEPAESRHKVLQRLCRGGNELARMALVQGLGHWRHLRTPAMTPEILSWLWDEREKVRKAALAVFTTVPSADLVGLEAELDALTEHEDASVATIAEYRRSELGAYLVEE